MKNENIIEFNQADYPNDFIHNLMSMYNLDSLGSLYVDITDPYNQKIKIECKHRGWSMGVKYDEWSSVKHNIYNMNESNHKIHLALRLIEGSKNHCNRLWKDYGRRVVKNKTGLSVVNNHRFKFRCIHQDITFVCVNNSIHYLYDNSTTIINIWDWYDEDCKRAVLSNNLNKSHHGKMLKEMQNYLSVPVLSDNNIKWYNDNSADYLQQTIDVDMGKAYGEVEKNIPLDAKILDAGSGVGRDTNYFLSMGYDVLSFDASEKMVEMTNQNDNAHCIQMTFNEWAYDPEFDLVWASASLLHVSPTDLEHVLTRLQKSLVVGGIIFFSLKLKIDPDKQSERTFYEHSQEEIDRILVGKRMMKLVKVWESGSSISSEEKFISYIYSN